LDILADYGTKSYIVGSTNSLLLQQKDRYSDILINLDNTTINITSSSLRAALALSVADRRWIDFITQSVNDTWDESNPSRPNTMGYVGSEEFIRLQFEEYILSLISAVKCHNYMKHHAHNPNKAQLPHVEGDPSLDFGVDWIDAWSRSENYRIWDRYTDSHLFDIVEPKHPCAGGLTIDDVQKRVLEQVKELHLDERFAVGKEALGRNLQAGKEKASTVFNKLYADMEALREAQRKKHEEAKLEAERNGSPLQSPGFAPDLNGAKATVQSVGKGVGAYMGSWSSWVDQKRKTGWGRSTSATQAQQRKEKENLSASTMTSPSFRSPVRSEKSTDFKGPTELRPMSQESYRESIFDSDGHKGHSAHSSVDIRPVDISHKRDHSGSIPPHPSKFHEVMDDDVAVKGVQRQKSSAAVEEKNDEDEHARSSAVAAAVEAATATPISP
jgi:hypothetical protein